MFRDLAKKFHVDVESFDSDKWSAALTMAKALDNIVDDDHIYDSGQYVERVIQGERIPYLTEEQVAFVRSTYDQLADQSKEQWRDSASQLGAFAIKRLEAENIRSYMDVVCEESPLMARVLQVENDPQRNDQQQRERFNAWLMRAVKTIYVLDTCSDFIKDHNEGNTSVQVTPYAVRELARSAIIESVSLARVTPLSVYPVFMRRSLTKTIEKTAQPGFWSNQFLWTRRDNSVDG
jgi:hypothetical protein